MTHVVDGGGSNVTGSRVSISGNVRRGDSMTIDKLVEINQSPENNRKNAREHVTIVARLLIAAGVRFNVEVLDLSASGFRMRTPNHISTNQLVYLTIPGLESLQGRIAWNFREYYGCEFTKPLHGSVFEHLLKAFPNFVS
jgi:PilZ domain